MDFISNLCVFLFAVGSFLYIVSFILRRVFAKKFSDQEVLEDGNNI